MSKNADVAVAFCSPNMMPAADSPADNIAHFWNSFACRSYLAFTSGCGFLRSPQRCVESSLTGQARPGLFRPTTRKIYVPLLNFLLKYGSSGSRIIVCLAFEPSDFFFCLLELKLHSRHGCLRCSKTFDGEWQLYEHGCPKLALVLTTRCPI